MNSIPTVLGIITARGGSKGIPGKNICEVGGKPLIAYTIEIAQKSSLFTRVIVSTDDERIAEVSKQYGATVPFLRPKELAEDTTPHLPVIQHALREMEQKEGKQFDIIVILQPTSPLRTVEDIEGTVSKLLESKADSAVTLVEITDSHPVKAKRLEGDTVMPYSISEEEGGRRQDLPVAYKRSGAVYAVRRETVVNQQSLYGEHVVGYVVPQERSIDIDEPFDLIKAEYMLTNLRNKGYEL